MHAAEIGFPELAPPKNMLEAFIQQHGTAEEILGPAAKYSVHTAFNVKFGSLYVILKRPCALCRRLRGSYAG